MIEGTVTAVHEVVVPLSLQAPKGWTEDIEVVVDTGGVAIGTFQSLTGNTDTVLPVKFRQPWACGPAAREPDAGRRRSG